MKTFIIDTNALLSFVTDRNLEQQKAVSEIFENATVMKCRILCHLNVITEFVYVLEKIYSQPKPVINQMIRDFISMPGVTVCHAVDLDMLLSYWPESISDYGDALLAALWHEYPQAIMVTFDKQFIKAMEQIGANIFSTDD
jgi:predicted nucleic-acid-binding protein